MSIDLTGWKNREPDERSTMCSKPELQCPVYGIDETFLGHHWALWTTGKISIPFQEQIDHVIQIMESTYGDTRPGFAFDKEVVEKFKVDSVALYEKYG